jgi:hypothetical protein
VFFALDSSPGRGRKKFREMKEFMQSLVTKLQIGLSNSQVGFLQYDDLTTGRDRVVFEKDDSSDKILWRIETMKYRKGKDSYLGNALKIVNNEVTFLISNNKTMKAEWFMRRFYQSSLFLISLWLTYTGWTFYSPTSITVK